MCNSRQRREGLEVTHSFDTSVIRSGKKKQCFFYPIRRVSRWIYVSLYFTIAQSLLLNPAACIQIDIAAANDSEENLFYWRFRSELPTRDQSVVT